MVIFHLWRLAGEVDDDRLVQRPTQIWNRGKCSFRKGISYDHIGEHSLVAFSDAIEERSQSAIGILNASIRFVIVSCNKRDGGPFRLAEIDEFFVVVFSIASNHSWCPVPQEYHALELLDLEAH